MKACRELKGVIPVVQTPLNADGSIDHAGQARLIDFLVDAGVGGFWTLGTNSEDMNLTFAKRLEVSSITIEQIRDLLGHRSIETTRRYLRSSAEELQSAVEGVM